MSIPTMIPHLEYVLEYRDAGEAWDEADFAYSHASAMEDAQDFVKNHPDKFVRVTRRDIQTVFYVAPEEGK